MAQTFGEFLARVGARAGLEAVVRYPLAVRAHHWTSFFFRVRTNPIEETSEKGAAAQKHIRSRFSKHFSLEHLGV